MSQYPFWLGGAASGMAALFTHPLDLTKIRMQTLKERTSMTAVMRQIIASQGIRGVYDGLSASLLRCMTHSVVRMGAYEHFKGEMKSPSTLSLLAAAAAAGGLAGTVGNPIEVILVRMTSDRVKPVAERYLYSNVVHGLIKTARTEGIKSLYRGLIPNTGRAILMNPAQLVSYDVIKDLIKDQNLMKDGPALHFIASLAAGTIATTVCAPFDVIKSRLMNAGPGSKASILSIASSGFKSDGIVYFFRGYVPTWLRLTPHTMLTLMFLEQLRIGWDML